MHPAELRPDLDALVKELERQNLEARAAYVLTLTYSGSAGSFAVEVARLMPQLITALRTAATDREELRTAREWRQKAEREWGDEYKLLTNERNSYADGLKAEFDRANKAQADLAATRTLAGELAGALERICATQKKYYGNGTGLHLAMAGEVEEARDLVTRYRAACPAPAKEGT